METTREREREREHQAQDPIVVRAVNKTYYRSEGPRFDPPFEYRNSEVDSGIRGPQDFYSERGPPPQDRAPTSGSGGYGYDGYEPQNNPNNPGNK